MEIEVKVQIETKDKLLAELKEQGSFLYEDYQKDVYYTPAHRNFTEAKPLKEWLRLRDSNGKYSINYKNWKIEADGTSHYCDEYETVLTSYGEAEKILLAIDCKPLITVEKKRTVWKYKDYEISFDEVEDLGSFVEIEYKGSEEKDPKEVTESMIKFLESQHVGAISRNFKGYPHLLLGKANLL